MKTELKPKADGNCECGKCGHDRFSNDETLWGYVRCDKCAALYSHPMLPEVTIADLLQE